MPDPADTYPVTGDTTEHGSPNSMRQEEQPITPRTTVFEALDCAPDARTLFRRRAFNPELECGVMTRVLSLQEASDRCGIRDLPKLLKELNASAKS